MASIKNKYEFYKGFLEALGAQDVAETEYKNEEELRKKILDTMGVEYVFDDVNQTDLFRGKFLEGLANGGGGGGSSDVSTATVTVQPGETLVENLSEFAGLSNAVNFDDIYQIESAVLAPANLAYTKTTVLYQGKSYLFDNQAGTAIESVSGSIEYKEDLGFYEITGDCTVIVVRTGSV